MAKSSSSTRCASTYALVAASWAAVGSPIPVIFLVPIGRAPVMVVLPSLFTLSPTAELAALAVLTAFVALVEAVLAVVFAVVAVLEAVVAVLEAVLAVASAVSAVVFAVSAVAFASSAIVVLSLVIFLASCVTYKFCKKLSLRSLDLIADPG